MQQILAIIIVSICLVTAISNIGSKVLVPGLGYQAAHCVSHVESGSLIVKNPDGSHTVTSPTGVVSNYKPCPITKDNVGHGAAWKAWGQYFNNNHVTNFTGIWPVPPNPTTAGSQTLFYWNGIEDSTNDEVLQPVLQWGASAAGGGQYWAIASWYVSSARSFWGDLADVNVGDKIFGSLFEDNSTGTWDVTTYDMQTNKSSSFKYKHPTPIETYSYVVLEAYTITQCTDYPANTKFEAFTNLIVALTTGPVTPTWQPEIQQPITCNEHAIAVSSSEVDIYF